MSVADTKEAMREADRAAYAEARERARPATAIEQHDPRLPGEGATAWRGDQTGRQS